MKLFLDENARDGGRKMDIGRETLLANRAKRPALPSAVALVSPKRRI